MQMLDRKAWYLHAWPWFIIALLTVTILACFLTIYLAIKYPDTPLDDQYYKVGLSVYEVESADKDRAQAK